METNDEVPVSGLVLNIVKRLIPPIDGFLLEIPGFSFPFQSKYEDFLSLLSRLGIDGTEEIIRTYFASDVIFDGTEEIVDDLIAKGEDRLCTDDLSSKNMGKIVQSVYSIEDLIPYMSKLHNRSSSQKVVALGEKISKLSDEEQKLFDFFMLVFVKLWLRYIAINSKPEQEFMLGVFIKANLGTFYENLNRLYDVELVPQSLIDYVRYNIHIPNEEQYLVEDADDAEEDEVELRRIPVFNNPDHLFNLIKEYFSPKHQEAVRSLFKSGYRDNDIIPVFDAELNKFTNFFKQLYEKKQITRCNKTQLIDWLQENFQYISGRTKKVTKFDVKNLSTLISTNQKPCKNPIIDVSVKDGIVTVTRAIDKK